jgi:hypothetical protein
MLDPDTSITIRFANTIACCPNTVSNRSTSRNRCSVVDTNDTSGTTGTATDFGFTPRLALLRHVDPQNFDDERCA